MYTKLYTESLPGVNYSQIDRVTGSASNTSYAIGARYGQSNYLYPSLHAKDMGPGCVPPYRSSDYGDWKTILELEGQNIGLNTTAPGPNYNFFTCPIVGTLESEYNCSVLISSGGYTNVGSFSLPKDGNKLEIVQEFSRETNTLTTTFISGENSGSIEVEKTTTYLGPLRYTNYCYPCIYRGTYTGGRYYYKCNPGYGTEVEWDSELIPIHIGNRYYGFALKPTLGRWRYLNQEWIGRSELEMRPGRWANSTTSATLRNQTDCRAWYSSQWNQS